MNHCHNPGCGKEITLETPHLVVKVERFGPNPMANILARAKKADYDSDDCATADFPTLLQPEPTYNP